jgi:hypothetical protein
VSTSVVPSEETTYTHEESAKRAAAAVWHCKPEETFAQNLSASYPWLHKNSVFLIKNIKHIKMLVAVSHDGIATPFQGAKNIAPLNQLLESENVQLPDSLGPEKLAGAIRAFTLGPGGFVASPSFWEAQQRSLKMWTTHDPQGGPALFQKYCESPVLSNEGQLWKLSFFYFNDQGGVEKWSVSGDAGKIRNADSSMVSPNGTFVFPYG